MANDSLSTDSIQEINLPRSGSQSAVDAEKQFDRVVDLLSAERHHSESSAVESTRIPTASWAEMDAAVTDHDGPMELSIVLPCLDEADTVGTCILKAIYALERMGVKGEVIVADNGSRDDSVEIAESLGAKVVHVEEPGYGAALMGGIEAASGKYVIMGDADDSYDFSQAHLFYEQLRDGADLVQGCRLAKGGGRVMPGAMPWLHHLGNPALTWLVRRMFSARVNDVYCGMRGFSKELYNRLDQRCTGMEFATEMIIKSTLFGAKIREVPITLHPDGREAHRPHLRTFRDGWRTLRFFLLLSPRWTFLIPGLTLALFGVAGSVLALGNFQLAGISFQAHTLLLSVLAILVASQLVTFAILARSFATTERILPPEPKLERVTEFFTLERSLRYSGALAISGCGVVGWKFLQWASTGFGPLEYGVSMSWLIPAAGAIALGCQLAFSGFMLHVIRLARR